MLSTRVLTVGLASTLLVSTGAFAAAAWAVSESLEGAALIARREEQTAYLLGAIALDMSRLPAQILEARTDEPDTAAAKLELPRRTAADARAARQELPPLLGPEERRVWSTLEPRLDRMLHRFDRAIVAVERGGGPLAEALLDAGAEDSTRLSEQLDVFRHISLHETEAAVTGIHTRAHRTLRIASIAWAALVAAMAFGWVLILRLVAAQRGALSAKLAALEAANHELEAFAGRVAHDMRNVLSPIQLGVAAIASASDDPGLRRIADRIDRSCVRGRDLVEGLLSFSRAAGRAATAPQSVGIAEEIEDVLDQLHETIRAADVEVTVRVPEHARVAVPRALFHAVLANLVGNAVKFMRGQPQRRLSIEVRESAGTWRIALADTGPGISEQEVPRVFEALYRGARSTGSGVGLGLATVKRIVESHGGEVRLTSVVGHGTTFTITLPRLAPLVSRSGEGAAEATRRPRSRPERSAE